MLLVLTMVARSINYRHKGVLPIEVYLYNGTVHYKKCKQLFEYQLGDIWWAQF